MVRLAAEPRDVRVEIADRGPGIPAEVLARIGEPFFTTKQPGRGMGLGLFLARAVFESVGGAMAIDSTLGAGTQVIVTLPRAIAVKPIAPAGDPRAADPAKVVSTRG